MKKMSELVPYQELRKSLSTNFEVLSEKKDLSPLGRTFQHIFTLKKAANLKIYQKYETVSNSKKLQRSTFPFAHIYK